MKPQQFAALAVVAVISLVAAIAIYTASRPWSQTAVGGGKLFPDLGSQAANVTRIEISQGAGKLSLERSGEAAWTIRESGGYPANPERIRALLTGLVEARLLEPKTRNEARYAFLELEDPARKDANSRLVRLLDGSGGTVAEAVLGKRRPPGFGTGRGGTYVRKPGEAQTWLVDSELSGGTDLRDWAKVRLYETPPAKVTKLTIGLKGEQPYDIIRESSGEHKLAEMPAGKKIKFVNAIDNIVEAASFAEFEDVRKAEGEMPAADLSTAALEMESGLKVSLQLRRDSDAAWLRLTAAGEGDAKKAADEITGRTAGWEFKISSSKADAILKRRDELLEASSS
jgi:hypothetical protein